MPISITWPLQWINKTFTSRARTEEILKPELEGSLNYKDFEKAVDFLPGNHRHWQSGLGLLASSLLLSYGVIFHKPPWSIARGAICGGLAGFGGGTAGQYMEFKAHVGFIHSLEDRDGFLKALSNVHTRMTGTALPGVDVSQQEIAGVTMPESDTQQKHDVSASPANKPSSEGRWNEIRAANARNTGRQSSWDALRQNYERSRVQKADDEPVSAESERAQDQARFDAMLEAERKKSQT
jgi:hypothetical protein